MHRAYYHDSKIFSDNRSFIRYVDCCCVILCVQVSQLRLSSAFSWEYDIGAAEMNWMISFLSS
jgi:hypothetical protein